MNSFDYFKAFYQSLDGFGMFILWISILLFVFLIIISICLLLKNKELNYLLAEKIEKEKDLERQLNIKVELKSDSELIRNLNKEQAISIKSHEFEEKKVESKPSPKEIEVIKEYDLPDDRNYSRKDEKSKYNYTENNHKEELYHNDNYKEKSKRFQTSPVNIERKKAEKISDEHAYNDNNQIEKVPSHSKDSGLNSIINKGTTSRTSKANKDFANSSNISFVEELSRKMEQEVKPQTIELTDYEKKQEDEAIISYDELVKNKDRLYNITDDEDDEGFIEELKYFRQSLQ